MRRPSPLDGPGMGYGPSAGPGRSRPGAGVWLLGLLCVLLAAALVVVGSRGPAGTGAAAPAAEVTVTVTAPPPAARAPATPETGTDAGEASTEPDGVRPAVAEFLRGWTERDAEARLPLLRRTATERLTDQLADADPAKLSAARAQGDAAVSQASDYAAVVEQPLSDGSTVTLQLIYDPTSPYGWLVDSIAPGA